MDTSQNFFRSIPELYVSIDCRLHILEITDFYLQMMNRTREEALGKYFFDAFPARSIEEKIALKGFDLAEGQRREQSRD